MGAWSPLPSSGTSLDVISERVLTDPGGRSVLCSDPALRDRVEGFLNASPIAWVVGPSSELSSATRESCDETDSLCFFDDPDRAREELRRSPEGRSLWGMYLAPLP